MTRTSGGGIFFIFFWIAWYGSSAAPDTFLPQKTAWPLEPPKPSDETWLWPCSNLKLVASVEKNASKAAWSRWGLSCLTCSVEKHSPYITCMMHFIIPAMAAPPSRWPMLDLAVDIMSGSGRAILICTFLTAPTSMGSPSEVPVPWHSQHVDSGAVILASLMARVIISSCAGPFGAVRLALRPSWAICVDRRTASLSSMSAPYFMNMPEVPSPRR
mmetsp:Transcript_100721/g.267731  ORF Transcript_100721/g.267731 Transcript_100721/m.267731 type:complete len:215 (-) Transcript_100721:1405-2049(-)